MNFFQRQAAAKRSSTRLIVLFALAVIGIVLAVDVVVWFVLGSGAQARGESPWGMLVFATLATLAVVGLGSLYRIASLRGGGETVALQLGGVPVPEESGDLHLRRLRNVVEEIAIASGVPVPKLFVLEQEAAINAFAAGYAPTDAAVAVTRGALERLNRDELQGVIAHEFSHILNGDMRLNVRLIGLLFGILMLGLIGRKLLWFGYGGRDRSAMAILAAALVAMAVGFIGLFFGRMIKAGVSRSRETLADASAVQFTRQTTGLAGALKKIGGLAPGSRLEQRGDAEEISHMLFGEGAGLSGLFATHPPLVERIRALEPGFDASQLEALSRQWALQPPDGLREDVQLGLHGGGLSGGSPDTVPDALPAIDTQAAVSPEGVTGQVAHPAADDYRRADTIVGGIPAQLRTLAAQHDAVLPLLLGLVLDDRSDVAQRQDADVAERLGAQTAADARWLRGGPLAELHPQLRLPLAALAFPVLRRRPRAELQAFLDTVQQVVHADDHVSLFEYCLGCLLQVQVGDALEPSRRARVGNRRGSSLREEVATLLAVVAHAGHADPEQAQLAYQAGTQRILPRDRLPYVQPEHGVLALDAVWAPLDALAPTAKQVLIEAITATIGHDGRMRVAETELLRTICGVLHCPLPPMLGTAAQA